MSDTRQQLDAFPRVQGRCPMGCGETLFLGAGGYVTCSWIDCPEPDAATRLLLDQGSLFLVKHGNDGRVRDVR